MPQNVWFIIQNNHLLLNTDKRLPTDSEMNTFTPYVLRKFLLGALSNIHYHCAEITEETLLPDVFQLYPLRQAFAFISPEQYGMAVKAASILNWDKNHQFCGRCGSETQHLRKIFERTCSTCGLSFFPRISPSIIVMIQKGDHLLMARSPHFAPGVYGLIAGFVDVGECIEEAVHREVMEEVGLRIKNLVYVGSQPWPFPDSLMLAFTADYDSGEIVIDTQEIEAAGWYKYDNLPGLPSTSLSIASALIHDFVRNATIKALGSL
ncbi:MAG: NAD(+) diphosphatase [Legionellaceae bacterium]|nr:NAD(+) diphosphatase [Legionellaceae bacterium]